MKSRLLTVPRMLVLPALLLALCVAFAIDQPKTTSVKGKVFRSDTNEPIANAVIVLLDEKKSDKQDNSVEAKTDDHGDYSLPTVVNGNYTVSIRAWYKTQEEAPCQLLMAKTADKNSTVMVAHNKINLCSKFSSRASLSKAVKKSSRTLISLARACSRNSL